MGFLRTEKRSLGYFWFPILENMHGSSFAISKKRRLYAPPFQERDLAPCSSRFLSICQSSRGAHRTRRTVKIRPELADSKNSEELTELWTKINAERVHRALDEDQARRARREDQALDERTEIVDSMDEKAKGEDSRSWKMALG